MVLTTTVQSQIQHPSAWLRADSAVLNAPSWVDVSGNELNATPSVGYMPSAFSRMNFNKCFEVGGAETFTLPLGINDSKHADVIVVYETLDTVGENALWQIQLDTATRIGQTTRRILNDNGQITYDTANRLKPVVNYLAQSWRTPEVCAPVLALCAADSLALNGHIAEALYFDHRISDTAVIQWISYLAVKYGVTLLQTDYLDSRRNVIWDYTGYPDYCTSIAGLGRDDSTGLCQKQTYFARTDGFRYGPVGEHQRGQCRSRLRRGFHSAWVQGQSAHRLHNIHAGWNHLRGHRAQHGAGDGQRKHLRHVHTAGHVGSAGQCFARPVDRPQWHR